MKQILSLAILLIFATSCSEPSYYGPKTASSQMDFLGLKIQLSENSYDSYIGMQGLLTGDQTMYDLMLNSFKKELKLAQESRSYDDPKEYTQPNKGQELKKAAINIVETYISVAKTELTQVKDENLRWESDRCQWFYEGGNIRIKEAYKVYVKLQKEIADEHSINLW